MTGFALREIAVIEIEITDKSAIKERCTIRSGFTAAYKRRLVTAAEVRDLIVKQSDEFIVECAQCATQCVQHTSLEFSDSKTGNFSEGGIHDEIRELLGLCHMSCILCRLVALVAASTARGAGDRYNRPHDQQKDQTNPNCR